MLIVLRWNVADEIVPCDCCSLGNLEQWSLRTKLWRPLGRSLKGHWKVPEDWRAPLRAGRGRGRHGRKMKQWGREKREGMGAVSRNPLEGPLRTLLRESSLQFLAQKKCFDYANVASYIQPSRSFVSTLVHFKKRCLKCQHKLKDDYYILGFAFFNTYMYLAMADVTVSVGFLLRLVHC